MIFSENDNITKILNGDKTQTRRLKRSGQWLSRYMTNKYPHWMPCVLAGIEGPMKWAVGHTYALQPGRGKSAVYWKRSQSGEIIIQQGIEWRPNDGPDGTDWDNMQRIDLRKDWLASGYQEARIRITDIREEDARRISEADVRAEGFDWFESFIGTWVEMHDNCKATQGVDMWCNSRLLRPVLATRPDERYQCFVLTFELVKE